MSPNPASVDHLIGSALAASADDLARALTSVDPADRRRLRALDRWYAGFAGQVRARQDLVAEVVLPALAERGALAEHELEAVADQHVLVDELVGHLGDAIGILAFALGEPAAWHARATALAAELADALDDQLAGERSQRHAAALDRDERRAVELEALRAALDGQTRFALPWLMSRLDAGERQVVLDAAPPTTRLRWRSTRLPYDRQFAAAFATN